MNENGVDKINREKTGKYIWGMTVCLLSVVAYLVLLLAVAVFNILTPLFGRYVDIGAYSTVYFIKQMLHTVLGIGAFIGIGCLSVFPLAVAIKGGLFSFKKNWLGLSIGAGVGLVFSVCNILIGGFCLLLNVISGLGRNVMTALTEAVRSFCQFLPGAAIAVALFLFVLMIFGLFKAIKNNKNI